MFLKSDAKHIVHPGNMAEGYYLNDAQALNGGCLWTVSYTHLLETYDMAYEGRNRRYYKLTEKGFAQLNLYKVEWKNYSSKISGLFEGGIG